VGTSRKSPPQSLELRRAVARCGELPGVSPGQPVTRQVSIPFFATWLSMLVVLLATHALIPVARNPAAHPSWLLWPIRNATLLAAIVGALVVIAGYVAISHRLQILRQHGAVVSFAAINQRHRLRVRCLRCRALWPSQQLHRVAHDGRADHCRDIRRLCHRAVVRPYGNQRDRPRHHRVCLHRDEHGGGHPRYVSGGFGVAGVARRLGVHGCRCGDRNPRLPRVRAVSV
jgi:hypothetical protein